MSYSFKAVIAIVGVNPCVPVPDRITKQLKATKGYIPVKGTINGFEFEQTLCPVRHSLHRLYVNGIMLKGSGTKVGDKATFALAYNENPPHAGIKMPSALKQRLMQEKLLELFDQQSPSRKKEVYRYLLSLKSATAFQRNIDRVIETLKATGQGSPWARK